MVGEVNRGGEAPKKVTKIEYIDLSGSDDEGLEKEDGSEGKEETFPGKDFPARIIAGDRKEKLNYQYISKESFFKYLKRTLPKEFIPTKKTSYVVGAIFLIVVLISLLNFPLGSMLSGNINIAIEIGYPFSFLVFDLVNVDDFPMKFWGLVWDLLIYIVVAYAVDVVLNYSLKGMFSLVEDKSAKPKVFKDKKFTIPIKEVDEKQKGALREADDSKKDSDDLIKDLVKKDKEKSASKRS